MNPENYGSREACEKLFKAGIVIETEFSWKRERKGEFIIVFTKWAAYETTPAPSMAEVWRELPRVIIRDGNNYWLTMQALAFLGHVRCGYYFSKEDHWCRYFNTDTEPNPTDALIDLLIWARKEKKDES